MSFTGQEAALHELEEKYGRNEEDKPPRVFTQDHVEFKRAGVRRGDGYITATGSSWNDVLEELDRRVK